MEPSNPSLSINSFQKLGRQKIAITGLLCIVGLAISQDYLTSKIQNTGFFISESMLYNSIWVFLFPFIYLEMLLLKKLPLKKRSFRFLLALSMGLVISLLHTLIFAGYFVSISHFIYSPSHHFSHLFNTAISNQLALLFLIYSLVPLIYRSFITTNSHVLASNPLQYPETINIRQGSKILLLPTAKIQCITTNKPYLFVHTDKQKYLADLRLKEFEPLLDPKIFLRVHRSSIVNSTCVKSLQSRKNGDFDVSLKNGQTVRLSRHYRNNWQQLLHRD